jgi:archaellum biogenesis protein FlaJ (TadC family)
MRGGAVPVIVWFCLNAVLFVVHLIMTGHAQADGLGAWLTAAFALGLLVVWVVVMVSESRQALHRGEPELDSDPEAVPAASLGAILIAFAVVACGFGLVFGTFLVLIAAGVFVGALFVLAREIRAGRRARSAWVQEASGR